MERTSPPVRLYMVISYFIKKMRDLQRRPPVVRRLPPRGRSIRRLPKSRALQWKPRLRLKTGFLPPAAPPRPTASSPLFSQIASRWFDILPWQPEEANLDLARAIPPPPRARHCTCPPARPSAILEEPPGFRRQDLRRDASEQPRWLISDASEHPRAEPTRVRDFV